MSKRPSKNIIFLIASGLAVAMGIWIGSITELQQNTKQINKIKSGILPVAKSLQEFNLIDHNQQEFSRHDLEGHWSLLFFGYTQCPDVCPVVLNVLNQVHQLMTEQSLIVPEIIFVSVDPERDSYSLLDQYVHYFNSDFIALTGNTKQLQNITQQLGVGYEKAPGGGGTIIGEDYLMDHSSSLVLINPQGKLHTWLTSPHSPMRIIDSIIRSQQHYKSTIVR